MVRRRLARAARRRRKLSQRDTPGRKQGRSRGPACACAALLPARLVAELGDGAACCKLVACVVGRHGGRLPIARFLQFHKPGAGGCERSAAGTSGLRSIGGAVVADLPATVAVALLSDGGDEGREAVLKLHADLRAADPARACYSAMLGAGLTLTTCYAAPMPAGPGRPFTTSAPRFTNTTCRTCCRPGASGRCRRRLQVGSDGALLGCDGRTA